MGLVLGLLLPPVLLSFLDGGWSGVILALPGALAGATAAGTWGRWREQAAGCADCEQSQPAPFAG